MAGMNDYQPGPFPTLSWTAAERAQSITKLRNYAIAEVRRLDDWYLGKRKSKRFGGYLTRFGAILAVAFAGAVPGLNQVLEWSAGWSVVALAVAGACLGIDRFAGFTSAWSRYMDASQKLGDLVYRFQLDWELADLRLDGAEADQELAIERVQRCRRLILAMMEILHGETGKWNAEFQRALRQIDRSTQPADPPATQAGQIRVVVENGADATEGWDLTLDGKEHGLKHGSEALVDVEPGKHHVTVDAVIGGEEKHAEETTQVKSGAVAEMRLQLQ